MNLLYVAHGAPGGIGRVESLLDAVWGRDNELRVTTIRRMSDPVSRWLARIMAAFLSARPDIVVLNHINFAPLAAAFRLLRPRIRIVVWAYGVEAWQRPTLLQRLGLSLTHQIWAISRYTGDEFAAASGLPRSRVAIVPLALLPERAQALRRQRKDPPDATPVVLTVSRLWVRNGEGKGIDHLIEAMATVDHGARLVIVGDGDDRWRLERLATDSGVESRVSFLGPVDDQTLVDLYARCRLFALPSLREGFGLATLEAMTAGKPVVAARAGAIPELVTHGETGLLVPYGDRRALAAAIESLIDDPAWAAGLGRRGNQVAEERFGFERFANQVITLLAGAP